jgi:hypothetical protein
MQEQDHQLQNKIYRLEQTNTTIVQNNKEKHLESENQIIDLQEQV